MGVTESRFVFVGHGIERAVVLDHREGRSGPATESVVVAALECGGHGDAGDGRCCEAGCHQCCVLHFVGRSTCWLEDSG